ncbi:hypothetical protein [Amycolatopsis sp. PS_44_ISF1]|uniref:hypothetical protein n=1 Tax=Amycolatopsis sp. PS_44_ISF1 TaxID=2974917 RepID=UPI0028DDCA2B|nr:hypothetical protein [Amycolatopsis sp. PS_44_ISF1]MDT8915771.1 hypothetical protein [Amycolatopsis sp. PS_44_ISF1]
MSRYGAWRARTREMAAHLTPKVITNFPFEVIVCLVAVLMGLPFLLGAGAPPSLLTLVGKAAFMVWSAALTVGGTTIAVGLRSPSRPYPLVVASGLQLTAGCFAVYAIAVFVVLHASGLAGLAAFASLSLVSLIRATHFRRIVDIQKGARRIRKERGE